MGFHTASEPANPWSRRTGHPWPWPTPSWRTPTRRCRNADGRRRANAPAERASPTRVVSSGIRRASIRGPTSARVPARDTPGRGRSGGGVEGAGGIGHLGLHGRVGHGNALLEQPLLLRQQLLQPVTVAALEAAEPIDLGPHLLRLNHQAPYPWLATGLKL